MTSQETSDESIVEAAELLRPRASSQVTTKRVSHGKEELSGQSDGKRQPKGSGIHKRVDVNTDNSSEMIELAPSRSVRVAQLAEAPNDTLVDGEPVATDATVQAAAGTILLGRYALRRRIGAGSAASVFEATDLRHGDRVAVKLLHEQHLNSTRLLKRFALEAKATRAIQSEKVLKMLDFGVSNDGVPFHVYELLQGRPLSDALRRNRLTFDEAVEVGMQTLLAVEAVHAAGFVHRDIKPENVFLHQDPSDGLCVKLLDFGIAKAVATSKNDESLTVNHTLVGTPYYMAPEQILGDPVSEQTDIWSVGAMLFYAMVGRPLFRAETLQELLRTILAMPVPRIEEQLENVPENIAVTLRYALQKDPQQRWPSARAMREVLVGW